MVASAAARPYQIVVSGASGFTGRLVCEHLARDYGDRIRWAMAGRDLRKLERVREELSHLYPHVKDVPILVADATDKTAMGNVLKQTQVVLALAGPFAKFGTQVVAEAVEQGTHYCDITGEIPWVKQSIMANDAKAKAKGVKVVHCCGYDSIPSDLGVLMMADYCQKQLGKQLSKVVTLVQPGRGGVSGGTIASVMYTMTAYPMSELTKLSDAYYLSHARPGTDRPAPLTPTFVPEADTWAAPWLMEGVNAKIVHYSNAIRPQGPYGPDFKYLEMAQTGSGWGGWFKGNLGSLALTLIGVGFALAPTRALLKRVLPAPGEGPSEEARKTGFWCNRLVAVTQETDNKPPTIVTGECGDRRDAGYWSTSRMILETGLALVLDADKIAKSEGVLSGGVLTPATAVGLVLLDRLRAAGFTWRVDGPVGGGGSATAPAQQTETTAPVKTQ